MSLEFSSSAEAALWGSLSQTSTSGLDMLQVKKIYLWAEGVSWEHVVAEKSVGYYGTACKEGVGFWARWQAGTWEDYMVLGASSEEEMYTLRVPGS
jgi:hypothetical protein